MLTCPSCGEAAIPAHSVRCSPDAPGSLGPTTGLPGVPVYSRCRACGSAFVRGGPEDFELVPAGALEGQTLWIVPPWKERSDEAELELSWDLVEAFYAQDIEGIDLGPLRALITLLRVEGFGSRLRAYQSLSSLFLSRSRSHRLRPDQSFLQFAPDRSGRVRVDGILSGTRYRFGPVPAVFRGRIRRTIEMLSDLPLD